MKRKKLTIVKGKKLAITENKCCRCSGQGTATPHSCPYPSEINGNDEENCNCCAGCEEGCALEI